MALFFMKISVRVFDFERGKGHGALEDLLHYLVVVLSLRFNIQRSLRFFENGWRLRFEGPDRWNAYFDSSISLLIIQITADTFLLLLRFHSVHVEYSVD